MVQMIHVTSLCDFCGAVVIVGDRREMENIPSEYPQTSTNDEEKCPRYPETKRSFHKTRDKMIRKFQK